MGILLFSNHFDDIVDALARTGCTDNDGLILVYEALDAIRISGGQRVEPALRERTPLFIRDRLPAANPAA